MMEKGNNALKIESLDYCICFDCNRIKDIQEVVSTKSGLKCLECGGYNLGEAGWTICPHQKMSAVKCPRAGKGIVDLGSGLECIDRCYFRA